MFSGLIHFTVCRSRKLTSAAVGGRQVEVFQVDGVDVLAELVAGVGVGLVDGVEALVLLLAALGAEDAELGQAGAVAAERGRIGAGGEGGEGGDDGGELHFDGYVGG